MTDSKKTHLAKSILAARAVSTPLLAVETLDQRALVREVVSLLAPAPVVGWDCVRGLYGCNNEGAKALALAAKKDEMEASTNLQDAALIAAKLPGVEKDGNGSPVSGGRKGCALLIMNAHRHLDQPGAVQAVGNLRDLYKQDQRTCILLAPAIILPSELAPDVVMLSEEAITDEAIESTAADLYHSVGLQPPDRAVLDQACAIGRGLSAFGCEQVLAMALTPEGFDFAEAWERKKVAVAQTPGLSLSLEKGEQLGGLAQIMKLVGQLKTSKKPPRVVVFVDEMEKELAGASGPLQDSSGVSQYGLKQLLTNMEDHNWGGLFFLGPPGTAKTATARAIASELGCPVLTYDMGGTKNPLVGESERGVREVFKVIRGIGSDRVLIIATCNQLDHIPPALQRRFWLGKWYFDLPTEEEKRAIWPIHLAKAEVDPAQPKPDDTNWTGAEIRNCCRFAGDLGMTLKEAAEFIVPIAVADPNGVERLRAQADGRLLSASYPGPYRKDSIIEGAQPPTRLIGMAAVLEQAVPETTAEKDKTKVN